MLNIFLTPVRFLKDNFKPFLAGTCKLQNTNIKIKKNYNSVTESNITAS